MWAKRYSGSCVSHSSATSPPVPPHVPHSRRAGCSPSPLQSNPPGAPSPHRALTGIQAPSTSPWFALFPNKRSKEGLGAEGTERRLCLSQPICLAPKRPWFLPVLAKISSKSDLTEACHWMMVKPVGPQREAEVVLHPMLGSGTVGDLVECIKRLFAAAIQSVCPVQRDGNADLQQKNPTNRC